MYEILNKPWISVIVFKLQKCTIQIVTKQTKTHNLTVRMAFQIIVFSILLYLITSEYCNIFIGWHIPVPQYKKAHNTTQAGGSKLWLLFSYRIPSSKIFS
jgi:hypothetical protein